MGSVCIHGHFYQPPRRNPWTDVIDAQPSAAPFHNWNERIHAECYAPNVAARLLDATGHLRDVSNNYSKMSFNMGPTLMQWLRDESPAIYRGIVQADAEACERHGGHGTAVAQSYHHAILPLCNERDRRTEIMWGIADFESHFGRRPEGMWLPETAVDVPTLESLAEQEILFTMLAPHQAGRIRPQGSTSWYPFGNHHLDHARPYWVRLPSGRSIAVYFYDGRLANRVAFDGLLHSGDRYAEELAGVARAVPAGGLVSVATDGESYGHHHRHGEMALARALELITEAPDLELTHYAAHLAKHPPTWEVEICDHTAWSCNDALERWGSGLAQGAGQHETTLWRRPMREALDSIRDRVTALMTGPGAQELGDPWRARDLYGRVLTAQSPADLDAAWQTILGSEHGTTMRSEALVYLEASREALRMYASCGWFFGGLDRIELIQNLGSARRCIELCESIGGDKIMKQFETRLERITTTSPEGLTGAAVLREAADGTERTGMRPVEKRKAGVLQHITSLPGPLDIGDLGPEAYRFVDWLVEAHVSSWQILPTVPTDQGGCPYSSWSALAGNPLLIDLQELVSVGLLDRLPAYEGEFVRDQVDFPAAQARRYPALERAADAFASDLAHPWRPLYESFKARADWLEDVADFVAIRSHWRDEPWWNWPQALRDRQPEAMAAMREELARVRERTCIIQFFFEHQWCRLKRYANGRGIELIGDLPLYVSEDSVDVWAHREQFVLGDSGRPSHVAGAPPDNFSATGQLWGNPLYDWQSMATDSYRWWKNRIARSLELTDWVRLDHFRGFAAYWSIPASAETAAEGAWVEGPGEHFFASLKSHFGTIPFIAEDLGSIDDGVWRLKAAIEAPGMLVLPFAFEHGSESEHLPAHHSKEAVVYTGTHDTDTVLGWWHGLPENLRDYVRRYLAVDGQDIAWDMIRLAMSSVAKLAVIPLQDILGLGTEARMNTPATVAGNWGWRLSEQPSAAHGARLRDLIGLYARCPAHAGL
ncbi:MAG: 4-alpha-glucanotransferase [Myxococcota bacterium]|nr:4-alpha-glucanotransferase [Myxococcota bacterium]